jgi:hypothetical protein
MIAGSQGVMGRSCSGPLDPQETSKSLASLASLSHVIAMTNAFTTTACKWWRSI